MPKMVCVTCQCELRAECNYTRVLEMAGDSPYKLWHADLWKCSGCGVEIVAGFGKMPRCEHFEPEFSDELAKAKTAKRFIYDYEKPQKKDEIK